MTNRSQLDETQHDLSRYRQMLVEVASVRGVSLWQDAWKRLKKNRAAMISLIALATITFFALITPVLPLQSPIKQNLPHRPFLGPNVVPVTLGVAQHEKEEAEINEKISAATPEQRNSLEGDLTRIQESHPLKKLWHKPGPITRQLLQLRIAMFGDWCVPSLLGTDALGRDVLSRILWGARVSLAVGFVAACVSLVIGVTYGATAGYLGGWIDNVMMRIVDILYSIPFIFVVIFLITVLSEEKRKAWLESWHINQMTIFYVVIGAIYWLTMARVVRGQIVSLKNEQFVDAAKTIGASSFRIIFRHLVPNVMGLVIVYLSLTVPAIMLFEAFLSFLGLGVQAPDVSWGGLVNDGIQVITPRKTYWWLVLFPSAALSFTLLALNYLGDGLRDALDPRLKNR